MLYYLTVKQRKTVCFSIHYLHILRAFHPILLKLGRSAAADSRNYSFEFAS